MRPLAQELPGARARRHRAQLKAAPRRRVPHPNRPACRSAHAEACQGGESPVGPRAGRAAGPLAAEHVPRVVCTVHARRRSSKLERTDAGLPVDDSLRCAWPPLLGALQSPRLSPGCNMADERAHRKRRPVRYTALLSPTQTDRHSGWDNAEIQRAVQKSLAAAKTQKSGGERNRSNGAKAAAASRPWNRLLAKLRGVLNKLSFAKLALQSHLAERKGWSAAMPAAADDGSAGLHQPAPASTAVVDAQADVAKYRCMTAELLRELERCDVTQGAWPAPGAPEAGSGPPASPTLPEGTGPSCAGSARPGSGAASDPPGPPQPAAASAASVPRAAADAGGRVPAGGGGAGPAPAAAAASPARASPAPPSSPRQDDDGGEHDDDDDDDDVVCVRCGLGTTTRTSTQSCSATTRAATGAGTACAWSHRPLWRTWRTRTRSGCATTAARSPRRLPSSSRRTRTSTPKPWQSLPMRWRQQRSRLTHWAARQQGRSPTRATL